MKTIFVTISRGALIRNLFHSGVVPMLLKKGYRVVVLTPYYKTPELFADFKHENLLLEPLYWDQRMRLRGIFKELDKGVVFNRTVYARYRYSIGTHQEPSRLLFPLRLIVFAPLRFIPGARELIRYLHALINPLRAHDYLFEKYEPSLVFNTATGADCGLIGSAKRFGVTTVDMPKSWDNVSQALFPSKADYLIVWNGYMRDQALRLQGCRSDQVAVVGIPQFDFYPKRAGLIPRDEFCKQLGLDPKKKILLYGSSGAELFDETKHVELILDFIEKGLLEDVNIIVRPHLGYKGDAERFSRLLGRRGVIVDTTDKQNHALRDHFDTSLNHVHHLFNSLYHAAVCINSASTLSLDAIACGTPVVNFCFDAISGVTKRESVKRLFVSDYVKSLMESRGTRLAHDKSEFFDALKDVIEKGKKISTEKVISDFIYRNDGKSAERIVHFLINKIG